MDRRILTLADDIVRIVWSGLAQRLVEDFPKRQEEERASLLQYVTKQRIS